MQYYYATPRKEVIGPIPESEFLDHAVHTRSISDDTLVWRTDMEDWVPFGAIKDMIMAPDTPEAQALMEAAKKAREKEAQTQLSYNIEFASFGRRALAVFLDFVFIVLISVAIMYPFYWEDGWQAIRSNHDVRTYQGIVTTLTDLLIPTLYEIVLVGLFSATFGKMILGLRIIKADTFDRVSFGKSIGRYFAKILSNITVGYGFIMALFDDENRTLHDRICSTRVIRISPIKQPKPPQASKP